MHRQSQRKTGCDARSGHASTDWQALEIQLTRTRTILQEILVHLQDVLRNLKMARAGGRFGEKTTPPPHGARTQRPQTGSAAGKTGASSTAGPAGSERFRAKPQSGFEARTDAGQARSAWSAGPDPGQGRAGRPFGEKAHAGESRSFRSGGSAFRAAGASAGASRERPRTEGTFRTAGGAAGAEREARAGHGAGYTAGASAGSGTGQTGGSPGQTAAGAGRPHARTAGRSGAGFRMDRERQHRARELARKGGMNLKCAYDILCLDYPCSVDEIKTAYRHMARLHHPDLGGDEEAMKDVNVAYELAMRFCAGPRRQSAAWAV